MTDRTDRAKWTNRIVGVLTIGIGLFMVAVGTGFVSTGSTGSHDGRWVAAVMGLAFTGGGLLATGWIRTGSVAGDILGTSIITALAIMFAWVSLFGEARGFSSSVGAAGAAVKTGGGVTIARVAFGFAGVLIGIVAGYAWWRVIRRALGMS